MRNFTAILLFTCFCLSQYTRQLSYWECKLSNTFLADPVKCDCEKLVIELDNSADTAPIPVHHTHIHPDDLYEPVLEQASLQNFPPNTYSLTLSCNTCCGIKEQPDHPPRKANSQ
jgi:hypothetical protein